MERFWFLTWTTYGTWLPGDARGFVSNVRVDDGPEVRHNEHGMPYDCDMPAFRAHVRSLLKGATVRLTPQHATRFAAQFQETATFRGWTLIVFAIMDNHVHIVVGVNGDPEPSKLLQDFKSYGSRCLNRDFSKPPSATWWTEGGSTRIVKGDLSNVVQYVRDQDAPHVLFMNESAIRSLFAPDRAETLLESHQGANALRSPVPAAPGSGS